LKTLHYAKYLAIYDKLNFSKYQITAKKMATNVATLA